MGNKLTIQTTQSVNYKSRKPYFGWVVKAKDDPKVRKVVGPLETCKDFLHETLETSLEDESNIELDTEATRIAVIFNLPEPVKDLNKSVIAIKQVANVIETANGWKKSLITSTNLVKGKAIGKATGEDKSVHAFLFTGDKRYMLNMPALHGTLFMLRSLYTIAHNLKEGTPEELVALIEKLQKEKDAGTHPKSAALTALENSSDFHYMDGIKTALRVYLSSLMKHHDALFEGMSLKEFYSRDNGNKSGILSYHGGFGLMALHTKSLYNRTLSERCSKLFNQGLKG